MTVCAIIDPAGRDPAANDPNDRDPNDRGPEAAREEAKRPRDLDALFLLAAAYGAATGLAEGTVSSRVLDGGNRLRDLRAGKDIGARRLAEALHWFAAHWPEGAPWPDSVVRPIVDRPEPADAAEATS